MGNFFEDIGDWFQDIIDLIRGKDDKPSGPRPWQELTKASLWDNNGRTRMMNVLSPGFSDDRFKQYRDWQL